MLEVAESKESRPEFQGNKNRFQNHSQHCKKYRGGGGGGGREGGGDGGRSKSS